MSQWADAHRILPGKTSAEPGPWRTDRTPYLREIMDHLGTGSDVERVVLMASAQVGKTEAGNNWLACSIATAPGPMLMVLPTLDAAKETSKIRLAPMIEATPALRERVQDARTRDSGNAMLLKEFPGGFLGLVGANSGTGLRSKPIRYLFCDEVDEYPADVGGQGDPLALAMKRTETFRNRKVFMVSTPTIDGVSRIQREFERSDQRRYFVPCPACGEMQALQWDQVRWDKGADGEHDLEAIRYECAICGAVIPESRKTWMLDRGEWRPTADKPTNGKTVGYHLNALVSPWRSWRECAEQFLEAKRAPELLKTFINTVLGEVWRDDVEEQEPEVLAARREPYTTETLPIGVVIITAGIDVQDDRLEIEAVGWGRDHESWGIDARVFHGDPGLRDVWDRLDEYLETHFTTTDGRQIKIDCMAIDTGGHRTTEVYRWAGPRFFRHVYAIKGVGGAGRPLAGKYNRAGKTRAERVRLYPVGVDDAKDTLFARMKISKPGPGYMHFPAGYTDEWFAQLCGERRIKEVDRKTGRVKWVWHKHRANEALDMRVYAMAALEIRGVRLNTLADRNDRALGSDEPATGASETKTKPARQRPRRRRGGYADWKN